jgi:ABC-type branched-subunit amino acid transport system ATPase component
MMLSDLQITNFRAFEDLRLKNLGRVNLIVGKNNAGKTSLLEALTLVVTKKETSALRSAYRIYPREEDHFDLWLVRDGTDLREAQVVATDDEVVRSCKVTIRDRPAASGHPGKMAMIERSEGASECAVHIQSAIGGGAELILPFAEAVRRRDGEKTIEDVMRAVDPRIRTIRLSTGRNNNTFIEVDLGLSARMPITQAGEGLSRILTILVQLLGAAPQFALLDEIENGIHHTAMPQVWKGIAEVAERMNVQIFATTHSHECLEAAHEAFAERSSYDLRVIQLYRVDQKTDGRVLDQSLIEAAISGEIDLR